MPPEESTCPGSSQECQYLSILQLFIWRTQSIPALHKATFKSPNPNPKKRILTVPNGRSGMIIPFYKGDMCTDPLDLGSWNSPTPSSPAAAATATIK